MNIKTERTAIKRNKPSRPCKDLLKTNYLFEGCKIIDWGCGRGDDLEYLKEEGFYISGFDPHYNPYQTLCTSNGADLIMSHYILNVIPSHEQRVDLIQEMWGVLNPGGCLSISVRSKREVDASARKGKWGKISDGWVASRDAFQKGFTFEDLFSMVSDLENIKHFENPIVDGSFETIRIVKNN